MQHIGQKLETLRNLSVPQGLGDYTHIPLSGVCGRMNFHLSTVSTRPWAGLYSQLPMYRLSILELALTNAPTCAGGGEGALDCYYIYDGQSTGESWTP
jgi:hypothetical protein